MGFDRGGRFTVLGRGGGGMNVEIPTDDGWRALAGVGVGYALATGLVFVLLFVVPFLIVRAL